ncbi:MAG: hypothetical protein CMK07_08820 [Ponticaulis sp.]|nr:hypothetical protein [Ponticaulis sp.]
MPAFLINSRTTTYTVVDPSSTYLLQEGDYILVDDYGIHASGTNTNNTYYINGSVVADAAYRAIYLQGKQSGVLYTNTIHVGETGMVAGSYGIYVSQDILELTNAGAIYGEISDAVYMSHISDGGHNIFNSGLIDGGGDGIDSNAGELDIENTGTIRGRFEAIEISQGFNLISNAGLISSRESSAIYIYNGDNTIVNLATGTIAAGRDVSDYGILISAGANNQLINHGSISSTGLGGGVRFQAPLSGTGSHSVTNTGSITSNESYAVSLEGGDSDLVNSGLIQSIDNHAVVVNGGANKIINEGTISSLDGNAILSLGDATFIRNSGEVLTESAAAIEFDGVSSAFRILNSGTLASNVPSEAVISGDATTAEIDIVNHGHITSGYTKAIEITGVDNSVYVRNFGVIDGAINLNSGDHTIRSQTGIIEGGIFLLGDGSSSLFLGDEDNTVYDFGEGGDRFDLGGGSDLISYSTSSSAIHADLQAGRGYSGYARGDVLIEVENLFGSAFEDHLLGDTGINELYGFDGDDILEGRGGNDELYGLDDNDDLLGGSGNDQLIGGLGGDDLTGGTGADVFVYEAISDSAVTGIGRDRILDFEKGVDLIDLSALGIQDFIYQAAFTGTGTSEVRFQNVGGGTKTLVQIDIDGDGNADSAIIINNAFINLTPDDFALGA